MKNEGVVIFLCMLVTTFTGIFLIKTSVAVTTTINDHPGESIQAVINGSFICHTP